MSLEERIQFWRREVRVLERMINDRTRDVEEQAEKVAANPDDLALLDRHHWAMGLESLSLRNHAEAVEMLAELEAKREVEM